ncbi:hypothetical protein V865_001283 [Kwoniella europaea PYCC6329]|uniref:Uncharacterized protein n=1 Tax=Kwoniella europaea PYCC6329 TaxID=1423913 RepID=A0AAX4KBV8_9TREE
MSAPTNNATLQSRVQSALSQFESYGQQSRDLEKYHFTSKGPSAQARYRNKDLSRLNDPSHLEKIVEYTWVDALKASVCGMIGTTVSPLTSGGDEMLQQVHLNMDKIRSLIPEAETQEFANTLKDQLEGQIVQHLATFVSMNYKDHLLSEFRIGDSLAATIIDLLTSEEKYKDKMEISKYLWRDNCHKRSISDVEHLLNRSEHPLFTFDPEGKNTHKIVSSFSINPSLSPVQVDHFIEQRREEAGREKIKAESRAAISTVDYYGSFLEGARTRRESNREEYLSRKRAEVEKVVFARSHLSDEDWKKDGDLLPMIYPVKMQNGELAMTKVDEYRQPHSTLVSLNKPPTVHLWESIEESKGDGDSSLFPDDNTAGERFKAVGIEDEPSESERSEWII